MLPQVAQVNLRDGLRNTSLPLVAKPLLWWGGVLIGVGLEKAHCHAGSYRARPRAERTVLDKVGMFLDWQLTEPINIVTYFLWMLERKIVWSKWKTFFSCSFCFKNLNLEIIRGLQTDCWFSEKIFRTDQRLQNVRAGRDFEFKFTCLDTESHRI